ncbi:MAG: tRNA (adenosine(37)-N6)-threonylcarbamoyltransferase complex dimerization subunit type 1 TsaB [Verrucomicrobia bacterium]|nr:MAG: tRNA (adenosine(37)-N6)-threonylcarbamoyltransferase complex dimerization subunit type 1 TsaB [Verrucomicrobiota bacterium]
MSILALEFSTSHRSVAALDPATGRQGFAEQTEGRATDAFGLIRRALDAAAMDVTDIDRVVVGLGPGSYTGIRNAIALAEGWAFARGIRMAGFSSVESLACRLFAEGCRDRVRIVVDAQQREFYVADWDLTGEAPIEQAPLRIVPAEKARRVPADMRLIGPDARRLDPDAAEAHPAAWMLARMAAASPAAEAPPGGLKPIYLRQPTFVKAPPPRPIPPV